MPQVTLFPLGFIHSHNPNYLNLNFKRYSKRIIQFTIVFLSVKLQPIMRSIYWRWKHARRRLNWSWTIGFWMSQNVATRILLYLWVILSRPSIRSGFCLSNQVGLKIFSNRSFHKLTSRFLVHPDKPLEMQALLSIDCERVHRHLIDCFID